MIISRRTIKLLPFVCVIGFLFTNYFFYYPTPCPTAPTAPPLRHAKNLKGKRLIYQSQSFEDKALYETIFRHIAPVHGGVILEMGALDGEKFSISKFFERYLGWKSILIEANPKNYEKLVRNRPSAVNVHTAICEGDEITFVGDNAVGGVEAYMKPGHKERWVKENDMRVSVPCSDLHDIFQKHSVTGIDVFILDVEGSELEVLRMMDWNVEVFIWVIEMGDVAPKDLLVKRLMAENGYVEVTSWNIMDFCTKGADCSSNRVFQKMEF